MYPTFSKRHYQQIAVVIKGMKSPNEVAQSFIKMFKADNSRFDEERFYRACTHVNYKEEL